MNRADTTLANWRTAPHNRWAFHHVRELIPSAEIANDPKRVRELPEAPRDLGLDEFLRQTDTDGMLVLQRGRVLFERYANGMAPHMPHILMSVSKSMLGLLFGALGLDPQRPVTDVLPELAGTAYRGATLRHLLDMRAGIAFDEDYLATAGPIVDYRKATGWNQLAPGEQPSDLHSFYRVLTKSDGPHGGRFQYVSPNTDLLGWVIERVTGRPYGELMSEHVWRRIGAEYSAYITVDRFGAPRAAGGMCATLRDLARVGLWMIEQPTPWIEDLERGGERAAWDAGNLVEVFPGLPLRYRSQWYFLEGNAPLLFGWGIHGQHLCVDRRNELVIAKLSSQGPPIDVERISLALQAVQQIRRRLA